MKSVKSITGRQPLKLGVKKLINEYIYRIDLDADYQRERVWSKKNQEDLLDSINGQEHDAVFSAW